MKIKTPVSYPRYASLGKSLGPRNKQTSFHSFFFRTVFGPPKSQNKGTLTDFNIKMTQLKSPINGVLSPHENYFGHYKIILKQVT